MRGIRLQNSTISNATRQTLAPFCTSSGFGGGAGGGGGRGRGGGFRPGSGPFNFDERAPDQPNSSDFKSDTRDSPVSTGSGRGHGRGKPISPPAGLPTFSAFISSIQQPPAGRGRGAAAPPVASQSQPEHDSQPSSDAEPRKPSFFTREGKVTDDSSQPKKPVHVPSEDEDGVVPTARLVDQESDVKLPEQILGVLSGHGRGKPMKQAGPETQLTQENRHRRAPQAPGAASSEDVRERRPVMSRDDAVRNARRILLQGEVDASDAGRGRGFVERGGFGRGRGRGRGRGVGRGGFGMRDVEEDTLDSSSEGPHLGDDKDGENLAKNFGPEMMNQLTTAFEEMASSVLPSPLEDEYLEAFDLNCAIEFEPEYLMGEFDMNPDIDEKEPIPLRDALERMKPFLMAYEGIQSQEEWEEIMEETMARVPLLKKIVDHYSGPDRVTAKKQQEELERVAKTLPGSAPSSVKQFTNRAVISLQSNPGWGFDKKCHFMDKLVWEVSQHYR